MLHKNPKRVQISLEKCYSKCKDNIRIDIEETACERCGPDLTGSGELHDRLLRTRDRRE
jgi:hypothetical protein